MVTHDIGAVIVHTNKIAYVGDKGLVMNENTKDFVRQIYEYYTDRVESFGLDECWLDVSESTLLFGDGTKIANEIRERIKRELGVTVSVGVSYNKVFAKLGSDMKKPDAVTVITENDFKEKIWGLPVEALLYVGIQQKRNLTIWLFLLSEIWPIAIRNFS